MSEDIGRTGVFLKDKKSIERIESFRDHARKVPSIAIGNHNMRIDAQNHLSQVIHEEAIKVGLPDLEFEGLYGIDLENGEFVKPV